MTAQEKISNDEQVIDNAVKFFVFNGFKANWKTRLKEFYVETEAITYEAFWRIVRLRVREINGSK